MSLEKDITQIKTLVEQDIFKAATPEQLAKRKEERIKELGNKPIIPIDAEARELDMKYWEAYTAVKNRLDALRADHDVDRCECSWERLEMEGLDMETTDLPGENGYVDRRCLRCGGWLDAG